jgi:predicted Zn-dependent protease
LQFVSVGVVIMADRYFYLPSAGVFFMLMYAAEVYVLQNKPGLRNAWWAIVGLFAVWCLWLTRAQTKTWKNSETLWQQVLRHYPTEDQAMESLANWYGKQNRVPEAEQMLERAVQDGCTRPNVYSALANCIAIKAGTAKDTSAQRTLRDRAFSLYAQSIALNPNNADTYFNRAFHGAHDLSGTRHRRPRHGNYARPAQSLAIQANARHGPEQPQTLRRSRADFE